MGFLNRPTLAKTDNPKPVVRTSKIKKKLVVIFILRFCIDYQLSLLFSHCIFYCSYHFTYHFKNFGSKLVAVFFCTVYMYGLHVVLLLVNMNQSTPVYYSTLYNSTSRCLLLPCSHRTCSDTVILGVLTIQSIRGSAWLGLGRSSP